MKQIGEKIRETRKENGWSQDSIYPGHQSLMSQIEKGIIKNPSKETLEIIAKSLETTFDELIKDTSWDPTKAQVALKGQYAFSTMDLSVTLHKSGIIDLTMKAYPRFNENGEENKFSPDSGEELITRCKNEACERNIESENQQFCMGCARRIIEQDETFLSGIISTSDFWCNLDNNLAEQRRANGVLKVRNRLIHQDRVKAHRLDPEKWYNNLDLIDEEKLYKAQESADEFIEGFWGAEYWEEHYGSVGTDEWGNLYVDGIESPLQQEFFSGLSSIVPEFREYWKKYYQDVHVLEGLIKELKRYEVAIRSGEVEDISDIENNMDETINLDSEEKES